MKQVEYDMDEQDYDWLQALNMERQRENQEPVSEEIFEVIMDQLEKEWFTLMKRVPKPDMDLPAEDSCCAVCDDGEGENSNAIVFCDGCNLAVHQDCYGVPYIPEGQWLCRKCTVSPEVPVACLLCPNEGGAFKQTPAGKWAHLLCAIWIPEVTIQNQVFMEPIEHIENISKLRWKLKCSLCRETKGACIQCDVKTCYAAFHVTCARKQKLLCSMKLMPEQEEQPLRAYCERHLLPDMMDFRNSYFKDLEERSEEIKRIRQSNKAARAYARTYKTGIPLVPQYIVDKVMNYIIEAEITKKIHVVLSICKYWSLKREARRGAPLLKRLHLEPWTTATSAAQQTEDDRGRKLEYLKRLKRDLTDLKELTGLIQNRESLKSEQTETVVQLLSGLLFPHEAALSQALETISALDPNGHFNTVGPTPEFRDYLEKVERPRSWSSIREKLDSHEYWDPYEFTADLQLVWDNAIAYYPAENELHQSAARLKQLAASTLSSLVSSLPTVDENSRSPAAFEPAIQAIEMLISGNKGEGGREETVLNTLLSSLGDPSKPLVDALVKQGRTPDTKLITMGDAHMETNHTPRTPERVRGPVSPSVPSTTPRARRGLILSTPKPPAQRRSLDTSVVSPVLQPVGQGVLKTPSPRKQLPVLRPYPSPGDHPPDSVTAATDTASIASSTRKRKRGDYEPSNRGAQDDSIQPDNETAMEVEPTASMDAAPSTAAPKRSRRQTEADSRAEAKRMKREKEAERRARRKAEAEAMALKKAEEKAAKNASAGVTSKSVSTQGASTNNDEDGALSSTSSLTDIDDDMPEQESGEEDNNAPKPERRAVPPRAKKESSRKIAPAQPVNPPRRNRRSSAPNPEPKKIEIPVGFKLQIGPGTKPRPPDEINPTRQKREAVMGEPPAIDSKGHMESGTYVWAKQDGHPWFPGVIFEPSDKSIPSRIHETKQWFCESANLTPEERSTVQIVRFFDNTGTWAWLAPKSIRCLLDNEERDQYFLNGRFRTSTLRTHVRQAYGRALKQKGHGPPTVDSTKAGPSESAVTEPAPSNDLTANEVPS